MRYPLFSKAQNESKQEKSSIKLSQKLSKAFQLKNYAIIKELSNSHTTFTLVKALEQLNNSELTNIVFLAQKEERLRDFFFSFSTEYKISILNTIRPVLLSKLLAQLTADQVADILSFVDSNLSKKIIYLSSPQLRKELNIISNFSHSQVGSIMNTTILTLPESFKISQALNYIKKKRYKSEIADELFVVNLKQEVVGIVSLQDLFFCSKNTISVREIIDKDFLSISAREQIGEAIELFQKYPFSTVAVLNEKEQLLGTITSKDILPEIIEESIEDVYRFYGIVNLQHSYIKSSAWEVVRSRLFWLVVLLFATTLTTLIIDKFESWGVTWTTGISSAILVPLIPLITDMCGNSGSQTAASIIQSFASNELKSEDFWLVLKKELKIAVIVGGIISLINFARLLIYYWIFPVTSGKLPAKTALLPYLDSYLKLPFYSKNIDFPFFNAVKTQEKQKYHAQLVGVVGSFVSSLALFLVIILSKLVGVVIPYLSFKFGKDPAALTTPVLTTLLDAFGTLIFFSIGVLVIGWCKDSLLVNQAVSQSIMHLNYQ